MKLAIITVGVVALALVVGFVGGVMHTANVVAADSICYSLPPDELERAVLANFTKETGQTAFPDSTQWAFMESPCAVLIVWNNGREKEPFTAMVGWSTIKEE